ncbi:hypothetical protein A3733_36420 [Pseudoalteromonas shioyasakiensis]|nr:hypothetical protein A3733_36420 [Pseudoalteromonas shioyasakiensis]
MRERGIIAHLHYIPIHLQPYYQALGFSDGDFPNAESYYKQAVTIPLHPTMAADEQQFVINTLIGLV